MRTVGVVIRLEVKILKSIVKPINTADHFADNTQTVKAMFGHAKILNLGVISEVQCPTVSLLQPTDAAEI